MDVVLAVEEVVAVPSMEAHGTSSTEERPRLVRDSVDCPKAMLFSSRVFEVQPLHRQYSRPVASFITSTESYVCCMGDAGNGSNLL